MAVKNLHLCLPSKGGQSVRKEERREEMEKIIKSSEAFLLDLRSNHYTQIFFVAGIFGFAYLVFLARDNFKKALKEKGYR